MTIREKNMLEACLTPNLENDIEVAEGHLILAIYLTLFLAKF